MGVVDDFCVWVTQASRGRAVGRALWLTANWQPDRHARIEPHIEAGKALLDAIVVKVAASRLAVRATPKCVDEITPRPIGIAGAKVGRDQRAENAH
jgi:hypothetical protein